MSRGTQDAQLWQYLGCWLGLFCDCTLQSDYQVQMAIMYLVPSHHCLEEVLRQFALMWKDDKDGHSNINWALIAWIWIKNPKDLVDWWPNSNFVSIEKWPSICSKKPWQVLASKLETGQPASHFRVRLCEAERWCHSLCMVLVCLLC